MIQQRKLTDRVDLVNAPLVVSSYAGAKVRDWSSATTTKNRPALLQPTSSSEDDQARETTTSDYLLFLLPGEPVTAASRIHSALLADDEHLEVLGRPRPVTRRGRVHHLEVDVQIVSDDD